MKVKSTRLGQRPVIQELSSFLRPCNTGSTQGTIEQLEAEIEVLKITMGTLLAKMVEKKVLTFDEALEVAGMHSSYRQYRHGEIELIQDPPPSPGILG